MCLLLLSKRESSLALFIRSHICSSNLLAGNLVCSSRLKTFLPCAWIFCFFHPSSFVIVAASSYTLSSGHLEIPSTNVSSSSGMCFAMWHYPLVISMRPRSLISSPTRLSFAPPHYLPRTLHSHCRRVRILRRRPFGPGHPTVIYTTHAVINIPATSSR